MTAKSALGLGLAALGVGWLVGLSESAVVAGVVSVLLAAALGLITAATGGAAGAGGTPTIPVTAAALLAILIVVLCVGATAGAFIRINGYLYNLDRLSKIAKIRDSEGESIIKFPLSPSAGLTTTITSPAVCDAVPTGAGDAASEGRLRTAIESQGGTRERALLARAQQRDNGFTMQQLAVVLRVLCEKPRTSQ